MFLDAMVLKAMIISVIALAMTLMAAMILAKPVLDAIVQDWMILPLNCSGYSHDKVIETQENDTFSALLQLHGSTK